MASHTHVAVRLIALLCVLSGCTYQPTYELTCSEEGAVDGERTCRDGVWVSAVDAGNNGTDASPDADAGGDCSESDDAFCERLGLSCDDVTAEDACGEMRTVNCGTCRSPAVCAGGGTDNVCACPRQTDDDFCNAYGATCGTLTARDECGQMRTAPCGDCGDLGTCSDNSCSCDAPAACQELAAECGTIDVDGRCANQTMISCGTCGDGASCQGATCVCDEGFDPVAEGCRDIDECANDNLNDCADVATCTNTPGSFQCECPDGTVGDGTECVVPPLVDSVQKVIITLDDGVATQAGTLPSGVDIGQTVLFATQKSNGVREGDQIGVHVSMSAVNQVTAERMDPEGETTVIVYAVQFNPLVATVQTGSFQFSDATRNEPLGQEVDPAKAFLVFNHVIDDNTSDKDDILVSGQFSADGSEVVLTRGGNTGSISGTYWVVEAVDDDFTVQHVVDDIPDGNGGATSTITSVDPAKSLLLYSYAADFSTDDPDRGHVRCELQSDTEVFCRRQNNTDPITDLAVQVVTFPGDETIQRGVVEVVSGLDGLSRNLDTPVDASRSIAFGGQLGLIGITQLGANNRNDTSAGVFTQEVAGGGLVIEVARGTPRDKRAFVSWQVMEW